MKSLRMTRPIAPIPLNYAARRNACLDSNVRLALNQALGTGNEVQTVLVFQTLDEIQANLELSCE
jgi:hypothetical protein